MVIHSSTQIKSGEEKKHKRIQNRKKQENKKNKEINDNNEEPVSPLID